MNCLLKIPMAAIAFISVLATMAAPPYSGTIFLDGDIITDESPSAFSSISSKGRDMRRMYDRRSEWIDVNAYLFEAEYSDDMSIEIQVNPEMPFEEAQAYAKKYAAIFGRLPAALRERVETSWVHYGTKLFGGGNNNLLIHTGQSEKYEALGILEETLVHEAAHTSLDPVYADDPDWISAQNADPEFISTYARDNPTREDIAESLLPWLMVRHFPDRISEGMKITIESTIPNRLEFFDNLNLNLFPLIGGSTQLRLSFKNTTHSPAPIQNKLRLISRQTLKVIYIKFPEVFTIKGRKIPYP